MTEFLDDGEFWLPSHFLNDDDLFKNRSNKTDTEASHGLPTEFPDEFSSFASKSAASSPVESLIWSVETESDEEDAMGGLAAQSVHSCRLQETHKVDAPKFSTPEKKLETWGMSGSPESTLNGFGSWSCGSAASSNGSPTGPSQFSSPPATPFGANNDAWDLIYSAADQVARLNLSGEGAPSYHPGRVLVPSRKPTQIPKNPSSGFYSNDSLTKNQKNQILNLQVKQSSSIWGNQANGRSSVENQPQQLQIQNRGRNIANENGRYGRPLGLPQSAWPPLQREHQIHHQPNTGSSIRANFIGEESGVRRESTGTGVFLPRRYTNSTSTPRKKQGSTVLLPARVVQALNLNVDDMNAQYQQRFNGGYATDHDALTDRRNALLSQQKRGVRAEGSVNHEACLPQEWTY